jgi:hypothetical protein
MVVLNAVAQRGFSPIILATNPSGDQKQQKPMATTDPLAHKLKGYPKLAGQIELRPQLAIFRRFGSLNALNLLYLQADLALFQNELEHQQGVDNRSGDPRKLEYATSWYRLSTSVENGDDSQLQLAHKLQEKLDKYSNTWPKRWWKRQQY